MPVISYTDLSHLTFYGAFTNGAFANGAFVASIVILLQAVYAIGVAGLALYGFNALWLTWIAYRDRHAHASSELFQQPIGDVSLPTVTIQLPIYNERHVVTRLIDACANLDYPRDKLQIHILDDSTDQTIAIIRRAVERWKRAGYDIEVIRRSERSGFKAGALAYALPLARGEFIAIFDADFVPQADFLRMTIPHFDGFAPEVAASNTKPIGFVQTRWAHLNVAYSALTRSQALALDGHFMIEQHARQAAGYAFGFNGSGGLWRRTCIADALVGGWQTDTLCEDLDLSYRAQLCGWQPLFLPQIEVPAEIPPQLSAFKRQQYRWATGSIQTLRKLGHRVWKSEWSLGKRFQGLVHLGSYLLHPLLLLLLLVPLPLMLLDIDPLWPLTYLSLASVGPPLLYATAQRQLHPRNWLQRWSYIGVLTLLGFGLSLNNSIAVAQALLGRGGQFLRTPKFDVRSTTDRWQSSSYRLGLEPVFYGEIVLCLYALIAIVVAWNRGALWSIPFLSLYLGGFGLMVSIELWQAWQANLTLLPPKRSSVAKL